MVVFDKPHSLNEMSMHYCPGCTHGIIHRLVAEVMALTTRKENHANPTILHTRSRLIHFLLHHVRFAYYYF